jgi:hypothetical protein
MSDRYDEIGLRIAADHASRDCSPMTLAATVADAMREDRKADKTRIIELQLLLQAQEYHTEEARHLFNKEAALRRAAEIKLTSLEFSLEVFDMAMGEKELANEAAFLADELEDEDEGETIC